MTSPLTAQQLDEIQARHKAATPGPWGVYEFGGGSAIDIAADLKDTGTGYRARREICRLEDEPLDNDPTHKEWTAEEDWAQVRADAEFIAHAPADVAALLAQIHRLRAQRKYLITQLAKRDAASGDADRKVQEFLAGPAEDTTAESLADDGFTSVEIANMLGGITEATTDIAAADNPTHLRWGLNDVLWGDDDTVTVLLSGPDREPYSLELEPDRAAVLREDLAGPEGEQTAIELLALATVLEIPRPDTAIPLQLRLSHGHTDRWAVCDREGRRWHREHGWVYEAQGIRDEKQRDATRYTLAEAVPLARKLAAGVQP
ncbi:hypothetical protein F3K34_43970 [Streptomyces sp. LBUM 1486]|uniref:hypothetical protein n=1 Tax=Streptomyces scabiei TaxID=1930 RepID=UPI001B340356|nr:MULTISPECIES: hypothetical protein [Streptomyces]MBP5918746.1 hypothetical protein [Streptomyces sp. LBUM 1486]MDX3282763.1 hypothetical protein [Streptomyces scabiei]